MEPKDIEFPGTMEPKDIEFPGTFVVLPYICNQNEPSEPMRDLVQASSLKELEKKARAIFKEVFDINPSRLKLRRNRFADAALDKDDCFILLTKMNSA